MKRWATDERPAALETLDVNSRTFDFQPDVFANREFFVDCADDPRVGERVVDVLGGRS